MSRIQHFTPALCALVLGVAALGGAAAASAATPAVSRIPAADVGDLNGDGLDEYALGAPAAADGLRPGAGLVTVVSPSRNAAGVRTLTIEGATPAEGIGWQVAGAGDLNGDGYGDLAVGAPHASDAGRLRAGAVYVIFGSAAPPAILDLAALTPSQGLRIDGAAAGDGLGGSLRRSDVNRDGHIDLLIGMLEPDPREYVIWGRSGLPGGALGLASLRPAQGRLYARGARARARSLRRTAGGRRPEG